MGIFVVWQQSFIASNTRPLKFTNDILMIAKLLMCNNLQFSVLVLGPIYMHFKTETSVHILLLLRK